MVPLVYDDEQFDMYQICDLIPGSGSFSNFLPWCAFASYKSGHVSSCNTRRYMSPAGTKIHFHSHTCCMAYSKTLSRPPHAYRCMSQQPNPRECCTRAHSKPDACTHTAGECTEGELCATCCTGMGCSRVTRCNACVADDALGRMLVKNMLKVCEVLGGF